MVTLQIVRVYQRHYVAKKAPSNDTLHADWWCGSELKLEGHVGIEGP